MDKYKAYINSCHRSLHLSQQEMMQRQLERIKNATDVITLNKKNLERRNKLLEAYPGHKEIHERKIAGIKFQINHRSSVIKERTQLFNYIKSLSPDEFTAIIKMKQADNITEHVPV